MRTLITLTAGLGLATALTGCNSLDALTPPADVGSGIARSSPVNDADLDVMANQEPVVRAAPSGEIARTPLQSSASAGPSDRAPADLPDGSADLPDGPADMAYATGSTPYRDPAGSLEAQADLLAHSSATMTATEDAATVAAFPARENAVRRSQERLDARHAPSLAEPEDAKAPAENDPAPVAAGAAAPPQTAMRDPKAAAAPAGTIRFLPIIGAPVEAVKPLSEALGADARAGGLTIKTAADPLSRHMLKGYFSAFKDGRKTVIVYVWDVLDGSGNRLHRIQGQDSVETPGKDVWSGVPAQAMRDIGRASIAAYLAWRDTQPG